MPSNFFLFLVILDVKNSLKLTVFWLVGWNCLKIQLHDHDLIEGFPMVANLINLVGLTVSEISMHRQNKQNEHLPSHIEFIYILLYLQLAKPSSIQSIHHFFIHNSLSIPFSCPFAKVISSKIITIFFSFFWDMAFLYMAKSHNHHVSSFFLGHGISFSKSCLILIYTSYTWSCSPPFISYLHINYIHHINPSIKIPTTVRTREKN